MEQFRQLIIDDDDKYYLIKIVDDRKNVRVVKYLKDERGLKEFLEFISLYLNNSNVNGVNRYFGATRIGFSCYEVLLCNSSMKIEIKSYHRDYKLINNIAYEAYVRNRELFFQNNMINYINITAKTNVLKFEGNDNCVNLTLNADVNMNILSSEREFIRELLAVRCGGKIVEIELVKDKNNMGKNWVASCGEFKMVFPTGYTYSTICGVIRDHNEIVSENRKRR